MSEPNLMFDLSIGLGNEMMVTPEDVAEALNRVAVALRHGVLFPPDASYLPDGNISDLNGNTVGRWSLVYE